MPRTLLRIAAAACGLVFMVDFSTAALASSYQQTVERIAATDDVGTAVALSQQVFAGGAAAVVLARVDAYPDALSGAPLAVRLGGPLLLTSADGLDDRVAAEITRLGATTVVLLGGSAALDPTVQTAVESSGVPDVRRIAGADRFDTSAQVADLVLQDSTVAGAYITAGVDPDPARGWPDAVAVSGLAALEGRPVLLTAPDRLPDSTATVLEDHGLQAVTLVGGAAAVKDTVVADLQARGVTVERLAGSDRFETSRRIVERGAEGSASLEPLMVTTGAAFAQPLVAGPSAAALGGSMLLLNGQSVAASEGTLTWIREHRVVLGEVLLVGGPTVVVPEVEAALREALGNPPAPAPEEPQEEQEGVAGTPPAGMEAPQRILPAAIDCPTAPVRPDQDLAAAVRAAPEGAVICVGPGVHRLSETILPRSRQQIVGLEGAILSGARVVSGFTRAANVWVVALRQEPVAPHGRCEPGVTTCTAAEALFVDGLKFERVADVTELRLGTYVWDAAAGLLHLGEDPAGRLVEFTSLRQAVAGTKRSDTWASDVVIQGLVIEKFANRAQQGAIDGSAGLDWRVLGNEVRWVHGTGIRLPAGGQIVGNLVHHNGQQGVSGSGDALLVEGNELASNNLARYDRDWEGGGAKFVGTTGLVVRDNYVHDNFGVGLWTDIDNIDTLIEGNVVRDNANAGIFHEISYDAVIRGNVSERNGLFEDNWAYGAGIQIAHSPNVVIEGNRIAGNANGISLIQQERGDGAHGPHLIRNVVVRDNHVEMAQGATGLWQDVGDLSIFSERDVVFERNTYTMPGASLNRFSWANRRVAPAEWQGFGNDANGLFAAE